MENNVFVVDGLTNKFFLSVDCFLCFINPIMQDTEKLARTAHIPQFKWEDEKDSFIPLDIAEREIKEELKHCDTNFQDLFYEILNIFNEMRDTCEFSLKGNYSYVSALLKAYPDFKNHKMYKKYYTKL